MIKQGLVCLLALTTVGVFAQQNGTRSADAAFRDVVKADAEWRKAQRDDGDEDAGRQAPAHLPHVDAATQAKALEHWRGVMAQLDGVQSAALTGEEPVNYKVYRAQIEVELNAAKFKEYERPANSDTQFWGGLAPLDARSFRTVEQYRRYIARLKDIPRYFDEQTANMRAGLARGFTPPRVTLVGRDQALKDVALAKDAEATGFWRPLAAMPSTIPTDEQMKLREEARQVITTAVMPAYAKLLRFFDEEYVPHAVEPLAATSLPDGKAYYQSKILEFTTTTMTPEEIHALGLSEMESIHKEMLAVIAETGFKGTSTNSSDENFADFLAFLRTDPQFYAKTPQQLLDHAAWIAKEFDAVASRYFGYEPRIRFGIVEVPPEIAPFYTAGRGGMTSYYLNTYDLPSRPLYSLPSLTLHESAPGHSWQQAVAKETADARKLPEFRRAYISAYGEGWALYCERLGTEMGIYRTPYERFGMLSYQAWRAARLVVDTGIHAQGWTREQAIAYVRANTALSQHEIETEVDRYISWPGQALSYYLGEMEIQKMRRKAEAALGAKFNLRAFHDAVLETGSVPLPVLEEHLEAWIAGGGKGPYAEMER